MLVIGHRGAAGRVAENTIAAVRHALAAGADGIEFDVRLHGGRLIVLHDATLDRTTDGHGPHRALSLAALRALHTGAGEPIPFLEEMLAVSGGGLLVNVEVKQPGIAREVAAALDAFTTTHPGWHSTLLLSAFDVDTTRELAALRGDKRLGVLYEKDFEDALARAGELAAWSLHMPLEDVAPRAVARAHARGLAVYVYTVNAIADIERCAAARVDGVFTDFPERVVAWNRRADAATG
jgi:glycerophosphoryl diester phosphodiesterase